MAKGLKDVARREKASSISVVRSCCVGVGIVLQETLKIWACVVSETINSEALQPTCVTFVSETIDSEALQPTCVSIGVSETIDSEALQPTCVSFGLLGK